MGKELELRPMAMRLGKLYAALVEAGATTDKASDGRGGRGIRHPDAGSSANSAGSKLFTGRRSWQQRRSSFASIGRD
jgi:hypothetical protein